MIVSPPPGISFGLSLFGSRHRIDAGHNVLHAEIDRKSVLARVGLHGVEDRLFAASGHQRLAVGRRLEQHSAKRPVVIPLIVGLVLEIPRQLARVRVQRDRRVGEEQVVVLSRREVAIWPGVVSLGDAEIDQVAGRVVAAGRPHRTAVAAFIQAHRSRCCRRVRSPLEWC